MEPRPQTDSRTTTADGFQLAARSTQVSGRVWLSLHQSLLFPEQGRRCTNSLAASWQTSPSLPPIDVWVSVCVTDTHTCQVISKPCICSRETAWNRKGVSLETEGELGFSLVSVPRNDYAVRLSSPTCQRRTRSPTCRELQVWSHVTTHTAHSVTATTNTIVRSRCSGNADKSHSISTVRTFREENRYPLII